MDDNPFGPWGTAHADQMQAAIENDDWPGLARLALDGWLHACSMDRADGSPVTLEQAIASIVNMKHHNLVLLAAEALMRTYNNGLGK